MRIVDNRLAQLEWDFRTTTQPVIHPNLDDVGLLGGELVDVLRDFCSLPGSQVVCDARQSPAPFERKALAGAEHASIGRPPRPLLIADLKNQILIGAQAENCRHPVRSISTQVLSLGTDQDLIFK